MTTSILYKEISQSGNLSTCRDFWTISENAPQDVFHQIHKKINNLYLLTYLEKLDEKEAKFIHFLLKYEGTATSLQLLQKKLLSEQEIELAYNSLKDKYLIFIRKSISQIKIVPYSFTIYPEIVNCLSQFPLMQFSDFIKMKDSPKQISNASFSLEWIKLFRANHGQYHTSSLEKTFLKDELKKHLSEESCEKAILFHKKFYSISFMNQIDVMQELKPINQKLIFINRVYQLFYFIKTKNIYLTSNKKIRKHDYKLLSNLFNGDNILLDLTIETLKDLNFLDIYNDQFQTTISFITFLRQSIDSKYKFILNLKSKTKHVFQLITQMKIKFFSLWDVAEHHFEKRVTDKGYFSYNILNDPELSEKDIHNCLDFLTQTGLLLIKENKYSLSLIAENILNNNAIEKNKVANKGGIIVNNNHTILVYPDQISDYHNFIIEMFADKLNDGMICQYQFSKNTIQRGIFLGFRYSDLIDCFIDNSSKNIPDNILYNIKSWANRIKTLSIKQVTVLQGDKDILNILKYDKLIAKHIESAGEKYLIWKNKNIPSYVEADEPIFLVWEGEDLSHEKD